MTSTNNVVRNAMAAKNAKFIGKPPARVKQLIELREKIPDANDMTDRIMGEVSSLGWGWDNARKAWRFDDSDIQSDVKEAFGRFMDAVRRDNLAQSVENLSNKKMAEDVKKMIAIAGKYA
jgi:hypothetical protein